MNRINVSVIIQQIARIAETQGGERSELTIKDGIVYITFPDGSYIDFTVPKHNAPPNPFDSDSEIKEKRRHDQRTV